MDRAKKRFASALDGLRSMHNKTEIAVDEKIVPEHCLLSKVVRHGYPDDARCIAYDPVQRLMAIGTGRGHVRIIGDAGVDYLLRHESDQAVQHIQFLVNEGGLITVCGSDMIHLWNFRQKCAEIVHSVQLSKESVSCIHLPTQSKWLVVGTDKGNVYFVSVGTFALSSYVINWNKAIDLSCRVHPGSVKQLCMCPTDCSRLLIVYEKGVSVIWNLTTREVDRFPLDPPIKTASWHYDGRQVMCGNVDGSISVFNVKKCSEPIQKSTPHGSGPCRPINQLDWRYNNDGEQVVIFSGGMPAEDGLPVPALTILRANRSATVLEMDNPILQFITLPSVPWPSCPQHPHSVAVLLKGDLMFIDLQHPNYPCLESPHAMDIHESGVTAIHYCSDCPSDLIAALTLVGCKQRKKGYSDRSWPINGGISRECATGHQELILTGHKDGTVRFWQASGEHLQLLYRLKTASHLERLEESSYPKDVSMACASIHLCTESRLLLVTGVSGHATLFRFVKGESMNTIAVVNIPSFVTCSQLSQQGGSDDRATPSGLQREMRRQKKLDSVETEMSTDTEDDDEGIFAFKVRGVPVKRPAGYQPELACLLAWPSTSTPPVMTTAALNSAYRVLALASINGLALVDISQCVLIYAWTSSELYGSDPTPSVQLSTQFSECPSSPGLGTEHSHSQWNGHVSPPRSTSPCSLMRNHPPPRGARACSPTPPSPPTSAVFPLARPPSADHLQVNDPHFLQPPSRLPQRTRTFTSSRSTVVNIIRRNTAELAASARQRFQKKEEEVKKEERVLVNRDRDDDPREERREVLHIEETIERSQRSQSVKSGGIMRRLTGRTKKVVRSNSFHTHIDEKRESEGDSSRESPALQRAAAVCSSPTASQHSLERTGKEDEAVTSLAFINSTSRKNDSRSTPVVWVGTSAGACIALNLLLPSDRLTNSVVVSPSVRIKAHGSARQMETLMDPKLQAIGTLLKLRGMVLYETFMDNHFCLLSAASDSYKDSSREESPSETAISNKVRTKISSSPTLSHSLDGEPTTNNGMNGNADFSQLLIVVSEWEIRVLTLPAFANAFMHKCDEVPLVKARCSHVRGQPVLMCLSAAGQLIVFSLPSLRILLNQQFIPHSIEADDPIVHKTSFSEHGLGVYMASPCEVEKFTVCADMAEQVDESIGELFVPADMPEQPKQQSLLKGVSALFSGTKQETFELDSVLVEKERPQSVGTSMRSVARTIPGPSVSMDRAHAGGVSAGMAAQMALQNLNERGERLNQVVDSTENLKNSAMNLSSRTGKLVEKYEKKKWYNF